MKHPLSAPKNKHHLFAVFAVITLLTSAYLSGISFDILNNNSTSEVQAVVGTLDVKSSTSAESTYPASSTWTSTGLGIGGTTGTAKLYVNGNVGLGTTNPAYPLDIGSSSGIRIGTGGTIQPILQRNTASGGLYIDTNGSITATALLTVRTGGAAAKFVINGDGHVGVGMTNPEGKLHVAESDADATPLFERTLTSTTGANSVARFLASTTGDMADTFGAAFTFNLRDSAGVINNIATIGARRDGADDSGRLEFTTRLGGTANLIMTMRPDGNVGIGTTNPFTRFAVTGDGTDDRDQGIQLMVPESTISSARIGLITDVSRQNAYIKFMKLNAAAARSGAIAFFTMGTNSDDGDERMRIDNLGNVGIGTTDPAGLLSVGVGVTTGLHVLSNGNVGIGTTAPTPLLHVTKSSNGINAITIENTSNGASAQARFQLRNDRSNAANQGFFSIYSTGYTGTAFGQTAADWVLLSADGTSNNGLIVGTATSDPVVFGTNNTERMRISSGGNVGIGTTAPSVALDVAGRGKFRMVDNSVVLKVLRTGSTLFTGDIRFSGDDSAGNEADYSYAYGNIESNLDGTESGGFAVVTYNAGLGTEKFRIKGNGNVGIGTTDPESRLQVTGGGLCVGSNANCNTDNNTEGVVYSSATAMSVYDVAENYPTRDKTLVPGEVVTMDPERSIFVTRSAEAYDPRAIGAISAEPGVLLGGFNGKQFKEERQVAIALTGRIPINVSGENGAIKQGDYVTTSTTPGKIMKATRAGAVIGQALEDWSPESGKTQVMVFIRSTLYDPDLYLTSSGDVSLTVDGSQFTVHGKNSDIIDRIGAFAHVIVGKLTVGLIEAKKIVVNGVDILEKMNTLTKRVDAQQKEIEELKQQVEALKKMR